MSQTPLPGIYSLQLLLFPPHLFDITATATPSNLTFPKYVMILLPDSSSVMSLSRLSSRFPETTHFPTTTTTSRNLDFFFFFFFELHKQLTSLSYYNCLFKISSSPNWEPPRTIYSLIVVSLAPRDHYMFNGRIISGKRK